VGNRTTTNNNSRNPSTLISEALKCFPATLTNTKKVLGMMVMGVPNVGKSTIINSLRMAEGMKKVARTGPLPGVTRTLSGFTVSENPPVFLVDTPGVFPPGNLQDKDRALKLALTGAIKDNLIGEIIIADYLLFSLNRLRSTIYVGEYGLREPSDDINVVLSFISNNLGCDKSGAAKHFIAKYRKGELGSFTLDQVPPPPPPTPSEIKSTNELDTNKIKTKEEILQEKRKQRKIDNKIKQKKLKEQKIQEKKKERKKLNKPK